MHLFLLVSFYLVSCYGRYQVDDWIDPTDMLNYDAAAGKMKYDKQYHTGKTEDLEEEQPPGTCQSDHLDCRTETNNWKQKDSPEVFSEREPNKIKGESKCLECSEDVDTLKKEIEEFRKKGEIYPRNCNPVFRRFLYRIINEARLLGLPDESQPEVHYDAELVLTKQMVAEFRRFLDDADWNTGPLDEALGGTLVRFRHHNEEEWSWKFEDYIGTDPFTVFMISLSLLCIVIVVSTELWTHISWFTQIKRLLGLCFLVSLVWNWMYLYKDAFAERQAKLTKIGNDHMCGKQMTWSESLFEWWKSSSSFQNDPCEEYFKALMVNPILLVPPTKAFAVTFTNFITEPLKHIGKGIGEFFHALLAEMPLLYQPIVLVIIALILLVFCYGFGTSVHHMNLLRRNHDGERQRLPPPYPEREENNQFIEGVNGRFYNNPQPIQPMHVDGQGDVLNLRPEVLYPMNQREASSNQQEFVDSTLEQVALKKRTHGQYISDESFRQPRSKDDPVDQSHLRQPPAKKALEDNPLGSQDQWKESIKYSGPVNQDLSDSHAELKENQLPDLKTSVNMSQFPGKTKEKKESTEEEKNQQLIKENGLADHVGNGPETLITSAEHVGAQGTTFSPTESQMPNPYLNVEDIYTDPGNEEYSETLSFVILEEPETFQDELSIKQTVVS